MPKRLREATKADMVQVAPGKYVPKDPALDPPDVTLASWVSNGDGTFRAVPFEDRLVRLTSKLAQQLGFYGQLNTLYRLGRAGFVEIIKVAPHTTLINLTSYYNHLRRCAEDEYLWEDKKVLEHYRGAI